MDGVPECGLHGVPDGGVVQLVQLYAFLDVGLHLFKGGLLFDVDGLELLLRKVGLCNIFSISSQVYYQ